MSAKRSFKKYMTKGSLPARAKLSFGVHSLYAFYILIQVITENMHSYEFDQVRRLRNSSEEKRFSVR